MEEAFGLLYLLTVRSPPPNQTFVPSTSIAFVSKASIESGTIGTYTLKKRIEAVKDCRNIGKKDMKYNDAMPKMKVDPESYVSFYLYLSSSCGSFNVNVK